MNKCMAIMCAAVAALAVCVYAADLSITDVASHATPALVSEVNTAFGQVETWSTNQSASSIASGNIAQARITNALLTAGPYIGGNIPIAAISNAIFGTGALVTNDVIVAGNTTNRWILAPAGGVYIVRSITAL